MTNGTLKELNPKELMKKVQTRGESLFTEREWKGDIYIITIHFEELFGTVEEDTEYYIDIIKEDAIDGYQSRLSTYKDHSHLTAEQVINKLEGFINYVC